MPAVPASLKAARASLLSRFIFPAGWFGRQRADDCVLGVTRSYPSNFSSAWLTLVRKQLCFLPNNLERPKKERTTEVWAGIRIVQ